MALSFDLSQATEKLDDNFHTYARRLHGMLNFSLPLYLSFYKKAEKITKIYKTLLLDKVNEYITVQKKRKYLLLAISDEFKILPKILSEQRVKVYKNGKLGNKVRIWYRKLYLSSYFFGAKNVYAYRRFFYGENPLTRFNLLNHFNIVSLPRFVDSQVRKLNFFNVYKIQNIDVLIQSYIQTKTKIIDWVFFKTLLDAYLFTVYPENLHAELAWVSDAFIHRLKYGRGLKYISNISDKTISIDLYNVCNAFYKRFIQLDISEKRPDRTDLLLRDLSIFKFVHREKLSMDVHECMDNTYWHTTVAGYGKSLRIRSREWWAKSKPKSKVMKERFCCLIPKKRKVKTYFSRTCLDFKSFFFTKKKYFLGTELTKKQKDVLEFDDFFYEEQEFFESFVRFTLPIIFYSYLL